VFFFCFRNFALFIIQKKTTKTKRCRERESLRVFIPIGPDNLNVVVEVDVECALSIRCPNPLQRERDTREIFEENFVAIWTIGALKESMII
jgi:hypothetical protein